MTTWNELLEEFRALGGTAENIRLGRGEFGRGLFPIEPGKPVAIHIPNNLLVPVGDWVFEGGAPRVGPNAKTGERLWTERLGKHHSASPVSANGYLYFLDDDGSTHVLKAEPKFTLVGRNDLGEECYASPAISGGQIFIRALRHLYCIGRAGERKSENNEPNPKSVRSRVIIEGK